MSIELNCEKTEMSVKEFKEILSKFPDDETVELCWYNDEIIVFAGPDEVLKYYA